MRPLVLFAGAVGLCLSQGVPPVAAGDWRLSENQLDSVTAAGPVFDLPSAFGSQTASLPTGSLLGPAVPPLQPQLPGPSTPAIPPNAVTVSGGGASATIGVPSAPADAAVGFIFEAGPTPGGSAARAGIQITSQGGQIIGGPVIASSGSSS